MNKLKFSKQSLYFLIGVLFIFSCKTQEKKYDYLFQNPEIALKDRVANLIEQMSLKEKVSQMRYDAPAIERGMNACMA